MFNFETIFLSICLFITCIIYFIIGLIHDIILYTIWTVKKLFIGCINGSKINFEYNFTKWVL